MGVTNEQVERFAALFDGLRSAYGTGRGHWVKRPPTSADFYVHLIGKGPGIGIAPLRPDNTVRFAAIDLDEPDFEAAREMQKYIPGTTWIERSRSGNAHVWAFLREPLEAWVAMGVLKEATLAAGKSGVEVFPKNHDFAKVRMGNYINLPWHGTRRPIQQQGAEHEGDWYDLATELEQFLDDAEESRSEPAEWRKKAKYLLITPPEQRERTGNFGEQKSLHICAEHVLSGEAGLITEGHRNGVLFMLASCLSNWEDVDHDEALMMLRDANTDLCRPPETDAEVRRILSNVERAGYTSTRCDDPLVLPFAHPDCRIAHPRR